MLDFDGAALLVIERGSRRLSPNEVAGTWPSDILKVARSNARMAGGFWLLLSYFAAAIFGSPHQLPNVTDGVAVQLLMDGAIDLPPVRAT